MDCEKGSHPNSIYHRLCYWIQVGLIGFMIFTGFEIHGWLSFFGFEPAIRFHKMGFYILLIVWPVTIVVSFLFKKHHSNSSEAPIGLIVFLLQFLTGIIYLNYNYWETSGLYISLRSIAYTHTLGGFAVVVYAILNIYRSCVLPKLNRT